MTYRSEKYSSLYRIAAILLWVTLALIIFGCSERKTTSTLPDTHPAEWIIPDSPDFHGNIVYSRGAESCAICHGADQNGGESGVSCIECHIREGGCALCHGGLDNTSGAPPYGLSGEIEDTSLAVGAHTAHLMGSLNAASVPCSTCHLVPTQSLDSAHFDLASPMPDSIAEIVWGGLEVGGEAVWDRDTRLCTGSYCHGNFVGGDTLNAPNWTGQNQAECGSCHDAGDNPVELLWKHEFHVDIAGLGCFHCHANVVDTGLGIVDPLLHVNGMVDTAIANQAVCDACHLPGAEPCAACHGGLNDNSGAPPYGLKGETDNSSLAVGAHTSHLEDSPVAAGIECEVCHVVPTEIIDSTHLDLGQPIRDSIAEIVWSGLGANGQTVWNRDTEDCSGSYCHGNFLGGNSYDPIWTGTDQSICGTCHDVDGDSLSIRLLGSHKFHVGVADIDCSACHYTVVDDNLNIISNTLHVNGNIETFTANPFLCDACHGFISSCVVCHGGQDNGSGAPPVGLDGETETTELAVGAHTAHMEGGSISDGVTCSQCHIRPAKPLDEGHLDSDGVPDIDFGSLAGASSSWNRAAATCSDTYCHGEFSGGNGNNTPLWTGGNSQAVCGSCHDAGSNPESLGGKHGDHAEEGVACYRCHSTTVDASLAIIGLDLHINGIFEVSFSDGQGNWINGQCTNTACHEAEDW